MLRANVFVWKEPALVLVAKRKMLGKNSKSWTFSIIFGRWVSCVLEFSRFFFNGTVKYFNFHPFKVLDRIFCCLKLFLQLFPSKFSGVSISNRIIENCENCVKPSWILKIEEKIFWNNLRNQVEKWGKRRKQLKEQKNFERYQKSWLIKPGASAF